MSDKQITLSLGGRAGFGVKKIFEDNGIERFEVLMNAGGYGGATNIAGPGPWAEVMDALAAFREEAAEAAEALVKVATLTATGQQEDVVEYMTTK